MWPDDDINEYIRERLREAREERGVTQEELAAVIGKNRVVISDIERGRVNVGTSDLSRMAAYLNKPIAYFFPPYNSVDDDMEPVEQEMHMIFSSLSSLAQGMAVQQLEELQQQVRAAERRMRGQEDTAAEAHRNERRSSPERPKRRTGKDPLPPSDPKL